MVQVGIEEAKVRLAELLQAAMGGEDVSIAIGDQQSIRLVPAIEPDSRRRPFGFAKGRIRMAEDFEAPLEEFEKYMR